MSEIAAKMCAINGRTCGIDAMMAASRTEWKTAWIAGKMSEIVAKMAGINGKIVLTVARIAGITGKMRVTVKKIIRIGVSGITVRGLGQDEAREASTVPAGPDHTAAVSEVAGNVG